MMKLLRMAFFVSLLGGVFLLSACQGAQQTTTAEPTPTQPAASQPVTITMVTDPSTPMMGEIELQFTILDESGQPVQGAEVNVAADHTDMSGMSMQGMATEEGDGRYNIVANFEMAGRWLLDVQVKSADLDYREEIELVVEQ